MCNRRVFFCYCILPLGWNPICIIVIKLSKYPGSLGVFLNCPVNKKKDRWKSQTALAFLNGNIAYLEGTLSEMLCFQENNSHLCFILQTKRQRNATALELCMFVHSCVCLYVCVSTPGMNYTSLVFARGVKWHTDNCLPVQQRMFYSPALHFCVLMAPFSVLGNVARKGLPAQMYSLTS